MKNVTAGFPLLSQNRHACQDRVVLMPVLNLIFDSVEGCGVARGGDSTFLKLT